VRKVPEPKAAPKAKEEKTFNWANCMVFAPDLLERYEGCRETDMTKQEMESCSKTLSYFMRHAVQKYKIQTYKVNGMEGWFKFDDMQRRVNDHLRRVTFNAARFMYCIANNDGQRFECYIAGPDPAEKSPFTMLLGSRKSTWRMAMLSRIPTFYTTMSAS
jgi:hypothetical protein